MLTQRRAGIAANKIHRAREEGSITLRQALNHLEKLSPYLSTSQFHKLLDLQNHAQYNPHLLDE